MNKGKCKVYLPLLLMLLPILLIGVPWYSNMIAADELFAFKNANGINVLISEHFRIGIIYTLCIIMQIVSIKNRSWKYSAITNTILIVVLIFYPLKVSTMVLRYLYEFYHVGFYIVVIFILANIVLNIILTTKQKKGR